MIPRQELVIGTIMARIRLARLRVVIRVLQPTAKSVLRQALSGYMLSAAVPITKR